MKAPRRSRWTALVVLFGAACSNPPYVELQIADARLPFLMPKIDFDALAVEARATGCANTLVRYAAHPLPATLSVVPGDCFKSKLTLQAIALFGERRVAESAWLSLEFPRSGALVATATLARLPGPRVRFRTGFESGDPIGGPKDMLFVVKERFVRNLIARVDPAFAIEGARSVQVKGVATSSGSLAIVRAASTDLVINPRDRLIYALRIDLIDAAATAGIDLQLDSGMTAKALGLADVSGVPVHPASAQGRSPGQWQRFIVDLTPAAGSRLVGILFGFDAREGGRRGSFDIHLDDVAIEAP